MGKERITIYELAQASNGRFGSVATPMFGYDFTTRDLYDTPGCVTDPDENAREPFSRQVRVPVRPHFGVIGVAPEASGVQSSVPPGVFGGNVDNWRFGTDATICYPSWVDGGNVYFGDPHFAQGDGEICGTAIEAPLTGRIRLGVAKDLKVTSPILETGYEWATHGFGETLDEAMKMAAEQMLDLLTIRGDLSLDDAYSLCSVAVDFGVTQVVDGVVGCHGLLTKSILA
jgi:acetamidase/formamidase